MMQYDYSCTNANKNEEIIVQDETIRLSENLSYVFRMFLISMVFIVFVLALSS